jgi:hypothetical protein
MIEDVYVPLRVTRLQKHRCAPDTFGTKTRTHAEGRTGIERHAKDGKISVFQILICGEAHKCPDSTKPR